MMSAPADSTSFQRMIIAIAWCLAWGSDRHPKIPLDQLRNLRTLLLSNQEPDEPHFQEILAPVKALLSLSSSGFKFPTNLAELESLVENNNSLWDQSVGLVYGGVTKVKGYVFESADLQEIRGASGLLDRINLLDLPAFFEGEKSDQFSQCQQAKDYCEQTRIEWLYPNFSILKDALIPELIIYSTGGNILAFCPVALIDDLANAIEKRYTDETLTANSCAVGRSYRLLETRLGLLPDPLSQNRWLDWYLDNRTSPLIPQLLGLPTGQTPDAETVTERFIQQKSFNELVKQLATDFEQRRSGNEPTIKLSTTDARHQRVARCYPPMFETHPLLRRDDGDHRSAVFQAENDPDDLASGLPGEPWFSESSARKRLMGQVTKRELKKVPQWWINSRLEWPSVVHQGKIATTATSWVKRFEDYLEEQGLAEDYFSESGRDVKEARSLPEIADCRIPSGPPASGYVAFLYADGNNMGGYIRRKIRSPQQYQDFSKQVFTATTEAVYEAIYHHLKPRRYKPDPSSSRYDKSEIWLYPFEIVAIGGDDVLLVVPADKALAIAKTLGDTFEQRLQQGYTLDQSYNYDPHQIHRYHSERLPTGSQQCELSMSIGVLITAENTPFYYAENLTSQLLKSAKKRAKSLRKKNYFGGTVDFLVMKSVTMISSDVQQFRKQGLTHSSAQGPTLKQYAAPYTLYELGGLLETAQALKEAKFPRSQLYQIRSLLERGKQSAILNYRYFRLRLTNPVAQNQLEMTFEKGWCQPKDPNNPGNLAPWMSYEEKDPIYPDRTRMGYETLWRELVDLYPFIEELAPSTAGSPASSQRRVAP